MKKNEKETRKMYVSPHIEVVEVDVEEGFAMSNVEVKGAANNFTSNSYGGGADGGSTMGDF